jgi:hypothetical protein
MDKNCTSTWIKIGQFYGFSMVSLAEVFFYAIQLSQLAENSANFSEIFTWVANSCIFDTRLATNVHQADG